MDKDKDKDWDLPDLPTVKGELAALGASIRADAKVVPFPEGPEGGDGMRSVVALDRVRDFPDPSYCVHGYTTCRICGEYVILGSETAVAVAVQGVIAVCLPCAMTHLPLTGPPERHLHDH